MMYEEYVHACIHAKAPPKKGQSMAGIYDSSLSLIKNATPTKQGRGMLIRPIHAYIIPHSLILAGAWLSSR
jgi:hypothetical protein